LALFGRRPPQRVDSLLMPASENLHNIGSDLAAVAPRPNDVGADRNDGDIERRQRMAAIIGWLKRRERRLACRLQSVYKVPHELG
jgi:hypothetical protein